jgi:hypothetical protein
MVSHLDNSVFETSTTMISVQSPDGWTTVSGTPDLQTDGNFECSASHMPSDLDAADEKSYRTNLSDTTLSEAVQTTLKNNLINSLRFECLANPKPKNSLRGN